MPNLRKGVHVLFVACLVKHRAVVKCKRHTDAIECHAVFFSRVGKPNNWIGEFVVRNMLFRRMLVQEGRIMLRVGEKQA